MANALLYFQLQITGELRDFIYSQTNIIRILFYYSDTMGNLGAFITLKGKDMKPNYTTYEAVVSFFSPYFFS